jgi:hypothetical protein
MATVSIRLGISLQEEAGAVLVGAGILILVLLLEAHLRVELVCGHHRGYAPAYCG